MNAAVLKEIERTIQFVDECYIQDLTQLHMARGKFDSHFRLLETLLADGAENRREDDGGILVDSVLMTPSRQTYGGEDALLATPSMASPPVSRATVNYDPFVDNITGGAAQAALAWQTRLCGEAAVGDADTRRRPTAESIPPERRHRSPPPDRAVPCQVLVEFKRKRMLQFESSTYVTPGEYVVVGGDRGEDIGLVTQSWPRGDREQGGPAAGCLEGAGRVLRLANALEVSQLQGVQTELEDRAVEVAQKKAEDHGLNMRIVDAEYQFDRKKLTFYYHSKQRLDFRTLVRDLYKTFRARIWMEPEGTS